jgi:ABC-type uncharacterized transport system auxiliary subunit
VRHIVAWLAPWLMAGCVALEIGGQAAPQTYHVLHDAAPAPSPRAAALVSALLVQAVPADALADTASIAFSPRAHQIAFYQLAAWTERPTRSLPRLLERRLEARRVADAVGPLGGRLRAAWLLTIRIDSLHHDVSALPGTARLALNAELFDRRSQRRVAHRQFEAGVATATADAAAAAAALSQGVARIFDALVPWLEDELQSAPAAAEPR